MRNHIYKWDSGLGATSKGEWVLTEVITSKIACEAIIEKINSMKKHSPN